MKKPRSATKTEIVQTLTEKTGLSRKEVIAVFEALARFIREQLTADGPGAVNLLGLVKISRAVRSPSKERFGRNLRTGETIVIPAKPERVVVRTRVLKILKDLV